VIKTERGSPAKQSRAGGTLNASHAVERASVRALLGFAANAGAHCPRRTTDQDNHYGVDCIKGRVLAGTRPIASAGAFVAIGEGVEGDTQNPAHRRCACLGPAAISTMIWAFG